MSKETQQLEIVPREPQPVAVSQPQSQGITIESAFHAAATKALDKDSLDVMKQLLAMDAERKFNMAFVKMQSEIPTIVAHTEVKNRGRYEKFEDIMRVIQPILVRNGFSVSFSQEAPGDRLVSTCLLMHIGGHSRPTSFAVRGGMQSDNLTQADCKSSTVAKRNALCNALNIVIQKDVFADEENDASLIGDPNHFVSLEVAESLEHRCQMTNSNIPAFLKFANATSFKTIPANKFDALDTMLKRKEQVGR